MKGKDCNNFEQGITKRLQEKYKPKVQCNIETIATRKNQKRIA